MLEREWSLDDLGLILRLTLTLGAELTPAASLLPVRMLLTTYSAALGAELGERLLQEVAAKLQQQLQRGLADGVASYTGKTQYEFGDLTKASWAKLQALAARDGDG